MTMLTEHEASSLLFDLAQRFSVPQLDESCEVCASLLAEASGITQCLAQRRLKGMLDNGELTAHPAMWQGRRVLAYRRANA